MSKKNVNQGSAPDAKAPETDELDGLLGPDEDEGPATSDTEPPGSDEGSVDAPPPPEDQPSPADKRKAAKLAKAAQAGAQAEQGAVPAKVRCLCNGETSGGVKFKPGDVIGMGAEDARHFLKLKAVEPIY